MTKALPDKPAKLPKVTGTKDAIQFEIDASTEETRHGLRLCFGTDDPNLVDMMVDHLAKTTFAPEGKGLVYSKALLALIRGIGPKDSVEGMLATQMIAIHGLTMRCANLAILKEQTPYGIEANMARAVKLSRTYTAQVQVLKDYRNKGEQRIRVDHVTVNDGGKAVVGDVHQGGGNG